jgi:AcrR family transcriptional regulator
MKKKQPGSPTRAIALTKHSIVLSAILLADSHGLEQLSMRKLGNKLGVEAMALYYHFANKKQLIEGMIDYIHGEIELPQDEKDLKTYMVKRAESVFEVLARHPWAAPIMESGVNPGPATLQDSEAMIRRFRQAGFSVDMTVHAVTILNIYIYGAAHQYAKLSFSTAQEASEVGAAVKDQFPAGAYPYLTEMITDHMLESGYNAIDEFNFGLNLILDGIARYKLPD